MMKTFKARMCRRVDYFSKDLRDSGLYYDDDIIHRVCLKFYFLDVIQSELHSAALEGNALFTCPVINVESPLGKPDVLYFVPASAESQDYMTPVDIDEIKIAEDTCAEQLRARGCCS
ncbi:unnamed protein product [Pocillopora meandrina]|uniref:Uncharacterized protein n=1 Tax=Pocillopora meandrina TaxID=46732 RepID=A0AAU9VRR1_9CNID|nr:unnamed protein product [Pocillopora meandrina]